MPGKNNVSQLRRGGDQTPKLGGGTKEEPSNNADSDAALNDIAGGATTKNGETKRGRPTTSTEKRTHRITVAFTPSQGEELKGKAGIAGQATFIYHELIKAGVISE